MLQRYSAVALERCSADALAAALLRRRQRCSATALPLQRYSAAVLQRYSGSALQNCSAIALQRYSAAVL